jgi:XTP/dITP diphosphohydrolase
MTDLLLATNNPGKLIELRSLLAEHAPWIRVLDPEMLGIQLEVAEDGNSYAENAARKALAYYQASRLPTLADDSGLEVEALNGAPGLHSARYDPAPNATSATRRARLIAALQPYPRPWRAVFHCTLAIADRQGKLHFVEGRCPGEIISEERGSGGFGYDPIFLLPDLGMTMAELALSQKNRRSHRALAVMAAVPLLKEL